jgi:ketopantoate reductase
MVRTPSSCLSPGNVRYLVPVLYDRIDNERVKMNVLIVGAGSVGLLYGYHLQKGGAQVAFYVRPKYVEESRRGFTLYPLNSRDGRSKPRRLEGCEILSTLEEVKARDFDQVWICIPSTGLYGGWFEDFAKALGPNTILVSLTPGLNDRAYILKYWPQERLVIGLITAIAYPAPLPGESVPEPGTAFYFPPFAPAPFEGDPTRVKAIVTALERGGMAAKHDDRMVANTGFPNIVLMSFVAGLEACGWSLDAVRKPPHLTRIHAAIKEGLAIVARRKGTSIPLPFRMLSGPVLKLAMGFAPRLMPFDLETYLEVHFTKVGAQTRQFFAEYMEAAEELGLEAPNLRELASMLKAL